MLQYKSIVCSECKHMLYCQHGTLTIQLLAECQYLRSSPGSLPADLRRQGGRMDRY